MAKENNFPPFLDPFFRSLRNGNFSFHVKQSKELSCPWTHLHYLQRSIFAEFVEWHEHKFWEFVKIYSQACLSLNSSFPGWIVHPGR